LEEKERQRVEKERQRVEKERQRVETERHRNINTELTIKIPSKAG
jgi:hypothetical protein